MTNIPQPTLPHALHRVVKTRAVVVFGLLFALASLASTSPTVHADDAIGPATQNSADAPVANANAGPKNIVVLQNTTNNSLLVRGHVQLGRVPSDQAGPANLAIATNSCQTACDTLAVALQVNLIDRDVAVFTPQNAAVAANAGCNGCHAVALALQYNIGVDDPSQVPPGVNQFVALMHQEMAHIAASSTSLGQAESEMLSVIGQFQGLAGYLMTTRDEKITPAGSAPAAAAPVAPPVAQPQPAATASPSPSPSPSPAPSPAQQPAASPSPTPTPQASPSPP